MMRVIEKIIRIWGALVIFCLFGGGVLYCMQSQYWDYVASAGALLAIPWIYIACIVAMFSCGRNRKKDSPPAEEGKTQDDNTAAIVTAIDLIRKS